MLMGWATWRRLPWKPFPPWVAVQANSQGWAANDGETMRSPLSLRAAPVAGFENGYEVDGRSVASPAAKPAKVTLVRSPGTMPLITPISGEGGGPEETKGNASQGDFFAWASGGNITIPAKAGVPGSSRQVTIYPVSGAEVEVPMCLKVPFSLPGRSTVADARGCVCDADPSITANPTLCGHPGAQSGRGNHRDQHCSGSFEGDDGVVLACVQLNGGDSIFLSSWLTNWHFY